MRWLRYAWILALLVFISPTPALAESMQQIAPSETQERATTSMLSRYLSTDQQQTNNNMTPFGTGEIGRGAECPGGSGRYCSNALPYCCRSNNGSVYCAPNAGACTR